MKHKISISVDERTIETVQEGIDLGKFRNVSHAFEFAIKQLGVKK